jgi:hypothetical protein
MQTPNDPLDPLLERWRMAAPEQERSVRQDVWRRIADAESAPPESSWLERLEAAFARPAFAAAFVCACLLGGLFLAEYRLSRMHEQHSALLQENYLRLVMPVMSGGAAEASPPRSP